VTEDRAPDFSLFSLDTLAAGPGRKTLQIYQPRMGHRFGHEAVALAGFVRVTENETVVDLGTGVGVIPLLLAHTGARLIGLEIQEDLAALARRNAELNGVALEVVRGDWREIKDLLPPASAEVVTCNPPFYETGRGRVSPEPSRAASRQAGRAALGEAVMAARYLLTDKGRFNLVGPAWRLVDFLVTMRQAGLEPKRLQFIHSRPDAPAGLVLIEARKGSGVECLIEPPLFS
jgi:tRNA1Val (adenine37-N6)-methyltransferase